LESHRQDSFGGGIQMIRWITQDLGTAARDQLGDSSGIEIVDVRNLVDKDGNRREVAMASVEEAVKLLRQGKRVVVCCDYGMSRSNAVAAGALAIHRSLPFADAVREVILRTGELEIKPEVLLVIEDAISRSAGSASLSVPGERNRVLITGGTGFIGKRLVDRLSRTCTVIAPGREEVDITKGSVALSLLVKEHCVTQLVHLATPRIYNTNAALGPMLVGLKNVIDVCRLHHVKVVFVSSWEIYSAYRSQSLLANESLPANPRGPYGLAKWLCEQMLEQEKSTCPAFEYQIVRLGPVYGTGSDRPRFIYRFMDLARRGDTIVAHRYLNGLPTLDLTHIDDAVSALAAVVESGAGGDFNIGPGHGVSTTAVAETIIGLMGSRSQITHQDVGEFAPNVAMESTRAHTVLGWRPAAILKTELERLIALAVQGTDGT
jgi:nucleoside-diphosphate-sugar epimerase